MRTLGGLGIALSLIFGLLFLAFMFEVYYLLWWKRRITGQELEEEPTRSRSNMAASSCTLLPVYCCNSSFSRSSAPLNTLTTTNGGFGSKPPEEIEADTDLMRLHNFSIPMGILFTINEETKEEMESEDVRSKMGSRGRSLSDVVFPTVTTPYLTPASSPPFFTPPMTPLNHYTGFNPLLETVEKGEAVWVMASPPPKFKFLRDAEEKLYRRTLIEEAMMVKMSNGLGPHGPQQHSGSSQKVVQFSSASSLI